MSKAIIDEYVAAEQWALQRADMWAYIATLLFIEAVDPRSTAGTGPMDVVRIPKKDRDIGRHYLVPEEMKAGTLKITLKEAPEGEETDA